MNEIIYRIVHPESKAVVYIGRTTKKLSVRLAGHISQKSGTEKCNWIAELLASNLFPIIEEIETVEVNAAERESYWINYYKGLGITLFNGNDKGVGRGMLYDEPTKTVVMKVPKSKVAEYRTEVKDKILKKWEVKKKR